MWSAKYLLKLQADDRVAFSYQYLNQPVRSTELGISPELFVKAEVPEEYDTIGVGIDLSAGMTERNDWTVFTLAGRVDDKVLASSTTGGCVRWATSTRSRPYANCSSNGTSWRE